MSTDKTFYILDVGNAGDNWDDAVKAQASSHRQAAKMDYGLMEALETDATDTPSTATVLVSEHKDGRDAVKFELSVQVTWTYGVKEIA